MLFFKFGDELNYENNLHWPIYIYYNVHHVNIKAWEKRNNYLQKQNHIFSNTWNLFLKPTKIKGLIQVLASVLEKHNYINLAFETNANNS